MTTLGYVRPEYATDIAILMEAYEGKHPKEIARIYRSLGDQLSRNKKLERRIRSNAPFSNVAWESLTARGQATPMYALAATIFDATFRYKVGKVLNDNRRLGIKKYRVLGAYPRCHGCKAMNGQIISSDHAENLRPHSCAREACALIIKPIADWNPQGTT